VRLLVQCVERGSAADVASQAHALTHSLTATDSDSDSDSEWVSVRPSYQRWRLAENGREGGREGLGGIGSWMRTN